MAVAFDAVGPSSAGFSETTSGSGSWTHTATAGAAVLVFLSVDAALTNNTVTCTYGGTSMTLLKSVNVANAGDGFGYLFGLANVPGGAQTVAFTSAQFTDVITGGSLSFTGSFPTVAAAFGTPGSAAASSGAQTITLGTSSASSMVAAFDAEGGTSMTGNSPGTNRWKVNHSSAGFCGTSGGATSPGTGGNVTVTFTGDTGSSFGLIAVEVLPLSIVLPGIPLESAAPGAPAPAAFVPGQLIHSTAGPQTYSESLAAPAALTAAPRRSAGRLLTTMATAGIVLTGLLGTFAAFGISVLAASGRIPGKLLSGAAAVSGPVRRNVRHLVSASVSALSSVVPVKNSGTVTIALTAALASVSSVVRGSQKSVGGTAAAGAAASRGMARSLAALAAVSPLAAPVKAKLIALAAAAGIPASIRETTGKRLAVSIAQTGSVARRITRFLLAMTAALAVAIPGSVYKLALTARPAITASAFALKEKTVALAAVAAIMESEISRTIGRPLQGNLAAAGHTVRKIGRGISPALSVIAPVKRACIIAVSASVSSAGSIAAKAFHNTGAIIYRLGLPFARWITGSLKKDWHS